MSLRGKLFVVTGGAGVAGEAVAGGLIRQGAQVALTSRSDSRIKDACSELDSPCLHGFVGDMASLAGAMTVRDEIIAMLGPIDGVIAALGGWWEGPPLTQIDADIWHQIIATNLTSHFISARTFVPALIGRPNSAYVMLGGVGGTMPIVHAGPVSVMGAAQTRLLEVLAAEQTGVRMHEVRIMTPIVTRHWDRTDRQPDWLTGQEVGDYLAQVVAPEFAGTDKSVLYIPGP